MDDVLETNAIVIELCAKPVSSMRKKGNFIEGFLPFAVHMRQTRRDIGVES